MLSLLYHTRLVCYKRDNFFYYFTKIPYYAAFGTEFSAAFSIFSINIPYPSVGFATNTCVTAPTSMPFWIIGEPDSSVVNKGQQNLRKNVFEMLHFFFARNGKYLCFLADSCVFMLTHSVIRK